MKNSSLVNRNKNYYSYYEARKSSRFFDKFESF